MISTKNPRGIAYTMYVVAFLDLFAVSLLVPLLSKHVRSLGASSTLAGLIGSMYGGLQLFSSPIVGKWSDEKGRKHVLLVCVLISMCGYACLGYSTTVLLVLMARIPVGVFKHTQELARGYLAHIVPKSEHSSIFGTFNSCGSIGFIVGPIVGGHIAEYENGFYYNASLTTVIYGITAFIIWMVIPESFEIKKQEKDVGEKLGFIASVKQVNWHNLWDIFLVRFLMGFAIMVYRSNFAMMLDYKYQVSPKSVGYIISYGGVVGTFSGFLIGKVHSFYNDDIKLLTHMCFVQTISIVGITFAPSLWVLLLSMAPLSVANAIARVASTKLTIERGKGQETGILLGLGGTVLSVARMASPTIGGIAQEFHLSGPGLVGTVFATLSILVLLMVPQNGRIDTDTGYEIAEKKHL